MPTAPFANNATAAAYYSQQVFGFAPVTQGATATFQAHITFGPVGSGAQYTSNDQSQYNAAIASMASAGGILEVMAGTYNPTAEFVTTGGNITVLWSPGAKIQLINGQTFGGAIVAGGASTWTSIYVVGSGSNMNVVGGPVIDGANNNSSSPGQTSALLIAGGNSNVKIYDAITTNVSRWSASVTGYYTTSTGTTFDGGNDGVVFYNRTSDHCGRNSIPDGGGLKLFNGCTQGVGVGTHKNIFEFNPRDTNCRFSAFDTNPQNNNNTNYHVNYERHGGYATFLNDGLTSTGSSAVHSCFALFIESAYPAASDGVKIFGGRYDMTGGGYGSGNIGLSLGASNRNVHVEGTEFTNADTGWAIITLTGSPLYGGNFTLKNLKSLKCQTGASISLNAGAGTMVRDVLVDGCIADDYGAQVMTAGLQMIITGNKPTYDLKIVNSDFSKVASSGTVFTGGSLFAGQRGLLFRDCRGITDQGVITSAFGTTTVNEIRVLGGSTGTPTANIAYRNLDLNTTVTSTGGASTITVIHGDGTTMGVVSTISGSTSAPTNSTWYEVVGTAAVVTVAGGTWPISGSGQGVIAFTAGNASVLLNGVINGVTSLSLPVGSIINFGAPSVAPTVTIAGNATPFQTLSTVSSLSETFTLPPVSTINWVTFSASTVVIQNNGTTITAPFLRYRELSPSLSTSGLTATITAGIHYETSGMPVKLSATGGSGLQIEGPDGSLLFSNVTDIQEANLDPPFRFQAVTTGPTAVVYRRSA